MPYADPEKRRAYHREYGRRRGLWGLTTPLPPNPLTREEWQFLAQETARKIGIRAWQQINKLAAVWGMGPFHVDSQKRQATESEPGRIRPATIWLREQGLD
jgi:hypothetical protein